jgi:hypothetical protein
MQAYAYGASASYVPPHHQSRRTLGRALVLEQPPETVPHQNGRQQADGGLGDGLFGDLRLDGQNLIWEKGLDLPQKRAL